VTTVEKLQKKVIDAQERNIAALEALLTAHRLGSASRADGAINRLETARKEVLAARVALEQLL